jgi:hypothetical protein
LTGDYLFFSNKKNNFRQMQNLQDFHPNMDLATFCQALVHCGMNQALVTNSIIMQGYDNMEVFAHFIAYDRAECSGRFCQQKVQAAP